MPTELFGQRASRVVNTISWRVERELRRHGREHELVTERHFLRQIKRETAAVSQPFTGAVNRLPAVFYEAS